MSTDSAIAAVAESDTSAAARQTQASARDPLTGFRTQAYFCKRLDRLIERRAWHYKSLTLVLLQLANFYEISAWVGRADARLLLNDLARLLEKVVPANSRLCRCHNLEFAVLLIDEGSRRAALIGEAIDQTLQTDGARLVPPQLKLTCGMGTVQIGPDTPTAEVAFARARHAIARRQLSQLASGGTSRSQAVPERELASRLRKALESGCDLQLNFQAIVSFRDDGRRRFELRTELLRGDSPLLARTFIDVAVQHALGEQLDRWVIEQVVSILQAEQEQTDSQLTVTLTQNTLVSIEFPIWLKSVLPAPLAQRLVLQVSEIDVLTAQHHLVRLQECSRKVGFKLAVSHFGITAEPLRYLSLIEAGWVKIDRSLINGLILDTGRQERLAELIARVHARGIQVIVPQIDDFSELPVLWRVGVDLVQGNCLHTPGRHRDFEFIEEIELTAN